MSKPDAREITLVVDGIEVPAREGAMLVDAARGGDIEIPVFCYEPKLGAPVGACRMCLVEIEGIPKLQTACSTPVRDGMVVHTQTEQVKEAQSAVVEFLLVNHPLDCPVCDKGGECPLQDIAMGWGPGRSRFTDPKRHFQKPLPLSPQVRIDRERCILCYRCVRFSQEISEDEQLQLLERGDRSFVGTFDDRPYDAPFHGNIIELCPVGALTSEQYRFRARPWEIEDAGSICTLCPSQCNVKFTVRDERVARVLARDNPEVDDGWLCDRGRFAFPALYKAPRIAEPMVRSGGQLRPVSWPEAIEAAAEGLRAAGQRTGAIAGGGTSNEEGYLIQRILRGALGSPHVDSRPDGKLPRELLEALARPELSISMPDLDGAGTILVLGCDPVREMPILDLRLRKARRRFGAKLVFADEAPASLDAGEEPVAIVWGRGVAERGPEGLRAVLDLADSLGLGEREGSGLLEVPAEANGRGLREVGCVPTAGPGLAEVPEGMGWPQIREALASRELSALFVANADPAGSHRDGSAWAEALAAASFVLCLADFENETVRHADVVFPAETHAEKMGTVTHPDGRVQRLRPGVAHPAGVRAGWQVLCELAAALGHEPELHTQPMVLEALAGEVPFYAGISNEEIGGRGVRWQEREAAQGAVR